ncbi:MAG: hypothetical protein AUK64_2177 [bacterium P201]|nr:MAG: hypothetical protein AUK64_2177 [bacterium P201]
MRYVRSVLLAIIGVWSIFTGIQFYNIDPGEPITYKEYGGDAYTGIQNAEAKTGDLIVTQSNIIAQGFGSIMIFGGLVMIACAIPVKKKND